MSDYQGNIIIKNPATPTGPSTYGRAPGMWKLNEVAYWIKQGVWPNPAIVPDQYFPYVSLLLSTTSLGNANNNLFVDSSGAFNPVSRNGNATQGSFTPYATNWSNYFDGTGDNLTIPSNAAFGFGTGDFTIEFWAYIPTWTSDAQLIGCHTAFAGFDWLIQQFSSGQFRWLDASLTLQSGTVPTTNQWNHYAVTRSGTTLRIFLNGTQTASGTSTANIPATRALGIMGDTGASATQIGYMSNVRIVKGTAVYTANFTPPTSPLTAISGTSLLTCQSNRFRDASSNNFTITANGNTSVQDFGPFSPTYPGAVYNQSDITNWSGFFDGTGDYLSVANSSANNLGTNDFTIELWFQSNTGTMNTHACFVASYSSPTSGSWAFKAQSGTTGYIQFASYGPSWNDWVTTTNIAADRQWHHCAVTRSGNTLRIFVDGAVAGTWDISGASSFTGGGHPLTTGFMAQDSTSYLNGNLSNVRIVKGTALYTSAFTPPTSPLTAISGTVYLTCQNPAFTDNSTNNFVITQNGNPTVAGNSPFNTVGYWSNYFDGTGDYLTVPYNSSLQFPGDFTVECWVYPVSKVQNFPCIVGNYSTYTSNGGFAIFASHNSATSGKYNVAFNGSFPVINSTDSIVYNAWAHLALVRSGSTITLYVNGVANGTATSSATVTGTSNNWWIGTAGDALSTGAFNGYISNLRAVKGTAVYTANFTPSTTPLTAISGTSLLTCQNGSFKDNSTNAFTVTRNGDTLIQSYNPFYTSTIASNGGSLYLDGSGDYLTSPTSPAYDFGSSNFTIEGWFYFTNATANALQTMYSNYTSFSPAGSIFFGKHSSVNSGCVSVWFSSYTTGSPLLAESTYPPNNAWTHYALVRNGNTFTLYRNGVSTASASWSGAATAGACPAFVGAAGDAVTSYNFPGYMSDFRITKSAVYTAAFTPPTAPLTPSGNTTLLINGMNAGVYDGTTINDMETVGNAQVSTVQSKFGGSSVYFDGSGDSGRIAVNQPALQFGTSNFTAEGWVYSTGGTGTYQHILTGGTSWTTGSGGIYWYYNGGSPTLGAAWNQIATNPAVNSGTLSINTWYHFALVRNGNTMTLYINGTSVSSISVTGVSLAFNNQSRTNIGGGGWDNDFAGYIDDLRVTNGVARYTANFTPPTQAFPTY